MIVLDVEDIVAQVATAVRRRFAGFVDRDDMVSECHLWIYSHPGRMAAYLDDLSFKRSAYRLRRDLTIACERYARREKSQMLGYDPEDEYFYASVAVGALLPAVVLGVYEPSPRDSDGSGGHSDPAEGGSWHALRADVSRAWDEAELKDVERQALVAYYVKDLTEREIAAEAGVDQSTISKRIRRGMGRMVSVLGGERPRGCPYDCECHDAPCRNRPGIRSNYSGNNQYVG